MFFVAADWIFLQYGGGEKYHSWCGKTPRSAMIMITCSPGETQVIRKIYAFVHITSDKFDNNNKTYRPILASV